MLLGEDERAVLDPDGPLPSTILGASGSLAGPGPSRGHAPDGRDRGSLQAALPCQAGDENVPLPRGPLTAFLNPPYQAGDEHVPLRGGCEVVAPYRSIVEVNV